MEEFIKDFYRGITQRYNKATALIIKLQDKLLKSIQIAKEIN